MEKPRDPPFKSWWYHSLSCLYEALINCAVRSLRNPTRWYCSLLVDVKEFQLYRGARSMGKGGVCTATNPCLFDEEVGL